MKINNFVILLIVLLTAGCQIDTSSDGDTGKDSLIRMVSEPAGTNCPAGGEKLLSGLDTDNNGVLDDFEILETRYVCSHALVDVTPEPVGTNCPAGGFKVSTGIDDNNDGLLDVAEIDISEYVCHGMPGGGGGGGGSSLVLVTVEPIGTNCPAGGYKIESGIDDNINTLLDSIEVDSTSFVCNGASGSDGTDGGDGTDGLNSLVLITAEPIGTSCPTGGYKIESGIDDNANTLLDSIEVDSTSFVCNGASGSDGTDGLNSLVLITAEPIGTNCPTGGYKIENGIDDNANTLLDSIEVDSTSYICNGASGTDGSDGLNSLLLISPEPAGLNCPYGGKKVESGIDDNGDNILNVPGEVDNTYYLCDAKKKIPRTPLNDTGILMESAINPYNESLELMTCYTANSNQQDCYFGWDNLMFNNALYKIGNGVAGFDFSKIASSGKDVPDDSLIWECVRDNLTNLVWETKWADDTGYRARNEVMVLADAQTAVSKMNDEAVCGFNDWRLPSLKELHGLVYYETQDTPFIDTTYFIYTFSGQYWTADLRTGNRAFVIDFTSNSEGGGITSADASSGILPFRAVRGGL